MTKNKADGGRDVREADEQQPVFTPPSAQQAAGGASSESNTRTKLGAYRPHARVTKAFSLPSRAKQSFADECNINHIMSRFEKTGILEHENKRQPQYTDLVPFDDYHQALNQTIEAQDAFDALPSELRTRFHNEPGEFLQFVENPDNAEELIELGLATPPPRPLEAIRVHADATSSGPDQTAQGTPEASPEPLATAVKAEPIS